MILPPLPPQFVLYKLKWDAEKGKWQKVPCDINGRNVDPTNPVNFRAAEDVLPYATWDETKTDQPFGLAWCLTATDNWFFLDIDNALMPDGSWDAEATAAFNAFPGAWGEVSVSATGLHVLGLCRPGELADKRNKFHNNLREFYTKDRFVAFSRNGFMRVGGVEEDYDHTATLAAWVPDRPPQEVWDGTIDERYTGPTDDDALIEMILKSKPSTGSQFGQKVTIQQLWEGREDVLSQFFPGAGPGKMDHSSADLALMNRLAFWTGKDRARMDRLFRQSGLMRPKYDKRVDYQTWTVNEAASKCEIVYDYVKNDTKQNKINDGLRSGRIMDVTTQQEHFANCAYIVNMHRVLIPDGRKLKPEQFNASFGGHEFIMDMENSKTTTKAFECFTESRAIAFPQHVGTCFNPGQPFGWVDEWDNVNTYLPPRRVPVPGDVSPMLELMTALFPTQGDIEIWMMWQAHNVQHPEIAPKWSPVLQGVEGCGKGLMTDAFAHAMGKEQCHWPKSETISEKFNGWIVGVTTAIVNEAHTRERFEVLNVLKPLITDQEQEVRPMGGEKYMTYVWLRLLFTTNFKDAIPKTQNDRRFAISFLNAQTSQDLTRLGLNEDFFRRFIHWRDHERGYDKWTQYLLDYRVDELPIRAPKTSSHDEAIGSSRGVVAQLIMEAVESDTVGFRGGWLSSVKVNEYLGNEGKKVAPKTLAKIIEECGYTPCGKSSLTIFQDDNKRPKLYVRNDLWSALLTPNDYIDAQGYSAVATIGSFS